MMEQLSQYQVVGTSLGWIPTHSPWNQMLQRSQSNINRSSNLFSLLQMHRASSSSSDGRLFPSRRLLSWNKLILSNSEISLAILLEIKPRSFRINKCEETSSKLE